MKRLLRIIFIASSGFLVSCAAPALRNQFDNYNEAYAATQNQQMLLNLARLENGHPAYYLALGLIDNKYTFQSQTTAGGNGGLTSTRNTLFPTGTPGSVFQKILATTFGINANESATASSNPEFQFIPINNETTARQVLEPISTDVFLQLYEQGYPIDQLLRIMIERVETTIRGDRVVLVNSPTLGTPESFERFLRSCAMLRDLQKRGYLDLESSARLSLLGSISFMSDSKNSSPNPTLKDYADADPEGFLLKTNTDGSWLIYKKYAEPKFVLRGENHAENPQTEAVSPSEFSAEANKALGFLKTMTVEQGSNSVASPAYSASDYGAMTNLILALNNGIVVQTEVGQGHGDATRLVLRSFNRTMESVAGEQAGLEALAKSDPNFKTMVPMSEQQPVLKMMWSGDPNVKNLVPPLAVVHYADKIYQITDPKLDPLAPNATWNRDVFRLMVALGSQVTVDISKFQRQVLELSQ